MPKPQSPLNTHCVTLFFLLIGFILSAKAAAEVQITEFSIEDGEVRIVFIDTESVLTEFALQRSISLAPRSWVDLPEASFSAIDETRFLFTVPLINVDKEFFRIAIPFIVGTALDPDGDGLPDALEALIRTNPAVYDSDDDGFSDGAEYGYGTDPVDPTNKPVYIDLPTVDFSRPHSVAREGSDPHHVRVLFDRPFIGIVNYSINSLSNTAAGVDFTLGEDPEETTGSIAVDGSSALIPLTIVDDSNVSGQRVVIINLKLNGEAYFIGGRASHAVLLEDNDAWWTGTLVPSSGEVSSRIFRLKIAREGGGTSTIFGAGAGKDGLPVPKEESSEGGPAIGDTSTSSTLIPEGEWLGTTHSDTADHFNVISPMMPVVAGARSLFSNETITRQLELNAELDLNSATQPHLLGDLRIVGNYSETLNISSGTPLTPQPGTFVLQRDIPQSLPNLSNLVPDAP